MRHCQWSVQVAPTFLQKKKQMLIKYVCTTSRSIIDLILPSKTKYTVNQFELNLKTSFHAIPLNNGQHIY